MRRFVTELSKIEENSVFSKSLSQVIVPTTASGIDDFNICVGFNHLVELIGLHEILFSDVVLSLHLFF